MTILARYTPKNIEVEIIDQPYECGGELLVPVKATEGKPFAGGDKWPVSTPYQTVKAAELAIDQVPGYVKPAGEKVTLLTLALAAARDQWSVGQVVKVYGSGERAAWLSNNDGLVQLYMAGDPRKTCTIFVLNHNTWRWEVSENVERNYRNWINRLQGRYEMDAAGLIFGVVILGLAWWMMTTGQRLADKADSKRKGRRNHEGQ